MLRQFYRKLRILLEKEHRQWEEAKRKAWFHDREDDITLEAWHDREATKAIKDEEIGWLLRG